MDENNAVLDQSANDNYSNESMNPTNWLVHVFTGLGKVMNYVGIAGFGVLSIVIFIFTYADKAHRDELFDAWFLFKAGNSQFMIIVMVLLIFLVMQQIHYKRVIAMKEERIEELAKKKSSKYSEQLNIRLSSSIKKRKP
jgi:hypothetical protein